MEIETIKNNSGVKWEIYNFVDIVEFLEGPGVRNWQFQDNGIKLINIRNLVDDKIDLTNTINHLSYNEVELKYKHFLLEEGDYVMASSGVTWGKIAEVSNEHLPLCLNTSIIKIKPKNNLLYKRYLWFFIKSIDFTSQIKRIITGSAQPNFGPSHLKQIQIPLPPLSVQKRIAEILDAADALRRKDQELLKKYDELAQAIFIDMFGDFSGKETSKCLLSEVSEITNGVTKNEKLEYSEMVDAPYLRVANVQDGYLDLSEIKSIKVKSSDYQKYQLLKSDILLTEGGDPDKLGRGTTWNEEIPGCIFQNHLFRIRVKNDSVKPFFLAKLIGSKHGKKYFLKAAKQTTGIATINSSQLKSFPVFIPPINKQMKYENLCLEVEKAKLNAILGLDYSYSLFQTLLQKAFKGELVAE
ncbi:type I restriction enzyme S subunit [Runella defluvii]|uniref:Type I restriction enzyme S subunit n=1 Tax=Runella defluvii TaxID=370973 RepID=A0A7W5ZMX6_9BACT|nr:restriction endonuclease subunit S [Runella defluvii]MBB3839841.1 type I restriction enzyme S subunit [Runella defluvii]